VEDSASQSDGALTPRQRDVLQLAALGMSNRQIGEQLSIAEQTVKNHLTAAMRRLSRHDRSHAVAVAIDEGLIFVESSPTPVRAID
jgi:DNA-binding NarL/FixJ family response regulator